MNHTIRAKTGLGFVLILLVMGSTIAFSIRGLSSGSGSFKTYRRLARSSVLSGRVQANMLMASKSAKNFLKTRDEKHLITYDKRFKNAETFALKQQATLEDSERVELNQLLVEQLGSYQRANHDVFQLMRTRDTILQQILNPQGIRMRKNLTKIMVSANQDDDSEAAYLAGRALERVLLGRLYMFKFLEDNKELDVERVRTELGIGFEEDFDLMTAAIDDPERKDLLKDFSTGREAYLTGFEKIVLTIQKRNTLITQDVEPLDESIAEISEQIKLSLKDDQDKLGPSVQKSNANTIRAALIGSSIAVLLAILIAFYFIRTITNSIVALGQSEAETERLSHEIAARKEAEQTLNEAKEQLTHELAVARELSDAADREHRVCLQGESIPVRALRENIEVLANNENPVLMTGPIGSGQEAVARAIHRSSSRTDRPFIYVACPHVSAAGDTLFGSHPDSSEQLSVGKMSLANGGTLYLEGIEALSRTAQENLLEILRDASDQRTAGQKPEPDVRIMTYASHDLADLVRQGNFNSELARILGTRRLAVPSLAERQDDVASLAKSIAVARARSLGKPLDGLSAESEERLTHYSWPGNIGELESVIERAVVLATGTTIEIPADLLQEGRRIGGYMLERQLGSGAMGEVWLARHALLARPSAVKLIRQESMQGDSSEREMLEQRFQREAQATSQLRSPHTVELYDFGVTEDGSFYYVMEFLNGVDMESLVTKFGPVDPARAVFLLCQACISLGEAHQTGLVHRDIKPANLFVCRLGPHYDFVKSLDFGIVRTTSGVGHQSVTSAGQIKGTPTSLSPEVIQGEQAGFEADIYGLGCVAYWLLTGRHVFEGTNTMALLAQHISQSPKPLSEFRSDLPSELEELVLNCLEKNPADRPSSAFELGERLASISLSNPWDNSRAMDWWNDNLPDSSNGAPKDSSSNTIIINSSDTK